MNKRLAIVLLLLLAATSLRADDPVARIRGDVFGIASAPHRLTGYDPGSLTASYRVEQRLRDMGFGKGSLFVQEFPVVMHETTECRLETEGGGYSIEAMRPNNLQASVTTGEGIAGRTLYAGRGEIEEYGRRVPEGRIVVFEFDCARRWMQAFALGAKAVLFIGSDEPVPSSAHHLDLPANLPRFHVSERVARELGLRERERDIRLFASGRWSERIGRNVIALIPGTQPGFSEDQPDEAFVLAAPIDSLSEVPLRSPGARGAANAAALLEIARILRVSPPRRTVILCFFDGQSQNHAGARAWYGALYRRYRQMRLARMSLEERLANFAEERAHVAAIAEALGRESFFDRTNGTPDGLADAVRMLKDEVRVVAGEVLEDLRTLRLQLAALEGGDTHAVALRDRVERLGEEDMAWNALLRDLDEGAISLANKPYFEGIMNKARRMAARRIAEIDAAVARARCALEMREAMGPAKLSVVLHIGMNLGDRSRRWSFIHGEDSSPLMDDRAGHYAGIYRAIEAVAADASEAAPDFDSRPLSLLYEPRLFAPARFADSTAIARILGILNLSVMTLFDNFPRDGQPCDTLDALDLEALGAQAVQAAAVIRVLGDSPELGRSSPLRPTARYDETRWTGNRPSGPTVRYAGAGSGLRAQSVRDAVVMVDRAWQWLNVDNAHPIPGFSPALRAMTNTNGNFELGPYCNKRYGAKYLPVAATFDREIVGGRLSGEVRTRGLVQTIVNQKCHDKLHKVKGGLENQSVDLTRVNGRTIVAYGASRGGINSLPMRAMSTAAFRADRHFLCEGAMYLSLYAPTDAAGAKIFNKRGIVLLNNASGEENYQGRGISLDDPFTPLMVPRRTAHDLRVLNTYRLGLLRANRITQDSLEMLNGVASDIEQDADGLCEADGLLDPEADLERYTGMYETAAALSRRVYGPLVDVMNDLVTAVVLLLLLAIPFAFALERLIIGTPHIYRQIGWFSAFFLATFVVLYLVNPAFRLAATPIIIFLAFAIILLSALVIFIMVRKLQAELKKLQGLSAAAHSADVSRVSTMMAAVKMGISTMRRRPLRTLLTASTVVLLTFTILTFASFGSTWGIRKTYEGPLAGEPRILVHHQMWGGIGGGTVDSVTGFLRRRAETVPRFWIAPSAWQVRTSLRDGTALNRLVASSTGRTITSITSLIGVDPRDVSRQERLRAVFADGALVDRLASDGIYLTAAASKALGLESGDIGRETVSVDGRTFTYSGNVRNEMAVFAQLDGSSPLPVDYEASSGGEIESFTTQAAQLMDDSEGAEFVTYTLDTVAVVGADAARRLGGGIRSFTVYPEDEEDIGEIGERVAAVTGLPTYVGAEGGVHRYLFTALVSASGVGDLLIPVALGGLIVFATMLGSVSDREREIYTFSSLGLAPPHVASLFFAEASIYAVVGGMGGYLLGQAVSRVLGWLAGMGMVSVPPMNFSSTNAIVTILIVMGTVLLSAAYPALKASRSANPGIQRAWRIPSPRGDVYDLVFPFTVSAYDITGVVSFIREHFENYSEAGLGVFAASEARVFRDARNGMPGVEARVALAPFDLGIEQRFMLVSQPSEIEGIDEVRIRIQRLSGAHGDWRRSNRVFINDLRKQFLIWRALADDTIEHYREQTLSAWDELPTKTIPETSTEEDHRG